MDIPKLLEERSQKLSQLSEAARNLSSQLSAINDEMLRLQGECRVLKLLHSPTNSQISPGPEVK